MKTAISLRSSIKKIKIPLKVFSVCTLILISCAGQSNREPLFVPDTVEDTAPDYSIDIDNIIETKSNRRSSGRENLNLPEWLLAYISGGIEEVEKIEFFTDKYCFIGTNEGSNFDALTKWAANYSAIQDFTRLAAFRLEKKLVSSASLYPADEYGEFFERLVKKAFVTEYQGAVMEDTYWIKKGDGGGAVYEFFVFISIDKISMQTVINDMIAQTRALVNPTRAQNAAINRLQQTFFEGF